MAVVSGYILAALFLFAVGRRFWYTLHGIRYKDVVRERQAAALAKRKARKG
jgi:hypothetical protein